MGNPQLLLPRSAVEQIRVQEQERVAGLLLPFFTQAAALEHWVARFDQCVIDRGSRMIDQLNIIQQKVYSLYSDLEKEYQDIGFPDADTKQTVDARLNGYHRLVDNEPGAYELLLELTKKMEIATRLAYLSVNVNRGGQPQGMTAPRKLIAQLAIENRGRTLHDTAMNVKGALEDWLSHHADKDEDYSLYHEAQSILSARKFTGQGDYVGTLIKRYKAEIGE